MNFTLYRCRLITQEPLFFASKEVSRSFITVPYIGNYALAYALNIAQQRYESIKSPQYREDLSNQKDIYIFPAKFVDFKWHTESFNCVGEGYFLQMGKNIVIDAQRYLEEVRVRRRPPVFNSPQSGSFKMIASESVAIFYLVSKTNDFRFPRYIRIGKLMTKCLLECESVNKCVTKVGKFFVPHPLNPIDLSSEYFVKSYFTISMKPIPLIENVRMEGPYIMFDEMCLPVQVAYFLYLGRGLQTKL